MNSLPRTVTKQGRGCDLNPGLSAPESSTLTTRTFACVIGVGSPAGGGAITGRTRLRSRPMTGPHRRLQTINIAGSGGPITAGGRLWGSATGEGNGPRTTGRGITASRRGTSLDSRSTSRVGWARETAGSGRVSGAVAHLSKLVGWSRV